MYGGRLSGARQRARGANKVSLEGHRQMQAVEPRYFRTEEKNHCTRGHTN